MSSVSPHRRSSTLGICLFYLALAAWFCAPLIEHPDALGINDWDQQFFYYASAIKSVVEYGQAPFWNPWYCGGNVLWANPQVPLITPVFALTPFVSLALAMKVNVVLHYWFGLIGMHLLLETIGLRSTVVKMYLAVVAVLSGAMALHLNVGHSVFLPCLYIPMQLHLAVKAWRDGKVSYMALAAALLALMIYNAAIQAVPMLLATLGGLSLAVSILERRWRPLVVAAAISVGGLLLAGPKLVPVVEWVASGSFVDARNVLERPDRMTVEMLLHTYLDRFQHRSLHFELQRSNWFEYGNYIGGLAACLIVASIAWAFLARGARDRALGSALASTAIVLFALSAGEFSAWAPASIAGHLPLFSSFRIPSRYTLAFVIVGAATTGWALAALERDLMLSRNARIWIGIVCVLAALDLVHQNRQQFRGVFPYPPLADHFHRGDGPTTLTVDTTTDPYASNSPVLRTLMSGKSLFNCYEPVQTRRTARPDAPLVVSTGDAVVSNVRFSPNRVEFSVVGGREPSRVVMNQNFAPGWTTTAGAIEPSPDDGRPSVELTPGQTGRFAFSFAPPGLWAGTGLLIVGLAAFGIGWRRTLP